MANEIQIGVQMARALQTISFADANYNASNTNEVILVSPDGYQFFNPNNGSIPQITGFVAGEGYVINSKTVRDSAGVISVPGNSNNVTDQQGNNLTDQQGNNIVVSNQ